MTHCYWMNFGLSCGINVEERVPFTSGLSHPCNLANGSNFKQYFKESVDSSDLVVGWDLNYKELFIISWKHLRLFTAVQKKKKQTQKTAAYSWNSLSLYK